MRGQRAIIRESSSFSKSEEMEVTEKIEESEEERSLSPQLMVRHKWESTSRRSKTTIFDSARFATRKNQEWHEKYANLEFIFEKHIHPQIETTYHITEAFNQLGWALILTLPTHYYPDLVR